MRVLNDLILDAVTVAMLQNSSGIRLDHMMVGDITAKIVSANPSAKSFLPADVDVTANSILETAHGYTTGVKGALTNSGGALPGGLSATDYYLIVVDVNNYKFATSQNNALAGTAVDITDQGTGTHTFTPNVTLAGAIKLQKNNEPPTLPANWVDVSSGSQNFSAAGNLNWALADIGYGEVRAVVTATSGTVIVSVRINAKGV